MSYGGGEYGFGMTGSASTICQLWIAETVQSASWSAESVTGLC